MSKQIAVRLPEDLIDFVDQVVSEGMAPSRASVVVRALERERRRQVAARDIEILTSVGDDPDMDSLVKHVAGLSLPVD
jgi:Arc/MetJ-type ribon-helix-helix transcriptional regulator